MSTKLQEKIEWLLKENNKTINDLATATNLTQQTIYNLLSNNCKFVKLETLLVIEKYLCCHPFSLVEIYVNENKEVQNLLENTKCCANYYFTEKIINEIKSTFENEEIDVWTGRAKIFLEALEEMIKFLDSKNLKIPLAITPILTLESLTYWKNKIYDWQGNKINTYINACLNNECHLFTIMPIIKIIKESILTKGLKNETLMSDLFLKIHLELLKEFENEKNLTEIKTPYVSTKLAFKLFELFKQIEVKSNNYNYLDFNGIKDKINDFSKFNDLLNELDYFNEEDGKIIYKIKETIFKFDLMMEINYQKAIQPILLKLKENFKN